MRQEHLKYRKSRKRRKRRKFIRRLFTVIYSIGLFFVVLALGSSALFLYMNYRQNEKRVVSYEELPWNLMLVNRWNPVPDDYETKLVEVEGGEYIDEKVYPMLREMLDAAEQENLGPIVASGYRTEEIQQELYEDKINAFLQEGYSERKARKLAEQWVARPGTSEHQLGLAVDINGNTYDIYLWLEENSYKYGFIYRYPEDKINITGIENEPWHYRYVGIEAATEIHEKNICLEEYLMELYGE